MKYTSEREFIASSLIPLQHLNVNLRNMWSRCIALQPTSVTLVYERTNVVRESRPVYMGKFFKCIIKLKRIPCILDPVFIIEVQRSEDYKCPINRGVINSSEISYALKGNQGQNRFLSFFGKTLKISFGSLMTEY